jgi:arylsulfatase A-like enzyme
VPAPRHHDRFANEPLPMPPSFNEADVSDKPAAIRRRPLLRPARIAGITENYRQRLESILAVDEGVAAIVRALQASGELANTLFVYTSDNGFFHGEHRIPAGKVQLYEPSVRVPLVLRGPGVPRGVRLTQQSINVDLAATIVDAANARAGRTLDGLSLLPVLRHRNRSLGRDVLLETPGYSAIHTPRYVYAEYRTGERELYDLKTDPDELASQHDNPAYARIRSDLARRLLRLEGCKGPTCR